MVLLIIIPFLNGYFIGNINPTFSDKPMYSNGYWISWRQGYGWCWVLCSDYRWDTSDHSKFGTLPPGSMFVLQQIKKVAQHCGDIHRNGFFNCTTLPFLMGTSMGTQPTGWPCLTRTSTSACANSSSHALPRSCWGFDLRSRDLMWSTDSGITTWLNIRLKYPLVICYIAIE